MKNREDELRDALEGLLFQFAYDGKSIDGRPSLFTGGLSALEDAFEVMGWPDPYAHPDLACCDEPGCSQRATCGTPTPNGYRSVCGEHYQQIERSLAVIPPHGGETREGRTGNG